MRPDTDGPSRFPALCAFISVGAVLHRPRRHRRARSSAPRGPPGTPQYQRRTHGQPPRARQPTALHTQQAQTPAPRRRPTAPDTSAMPKKGKKGKKAAAEEAARLEAEKAAAEAVRRGVPETFVDSSLDTSIARRHAIAAASSRCLIHAGGEAQVRGTARSPRTGTPSERGTDREARAGRPGPGDGF